MTKGILYLIPTELAPSTGDRVLGQQAFDIIKQLDTYLVENVRTSRRFISSLRLGLTIEDLTFHELDKKTSSEKINEYLKLVAAGKSVGIMSEAGSPGVADPGAALVARAHELNIPVVPIVGPSSFLLALMASGMNGQRFRFHGYLPIDRPKRQAALVSLDKDARQLQEAQMFMETPYRNNHLLEDILGCCNKSTRLCIASDITGANQFIKTNTIAQWKAKKLDLHKIPTVFILQG
ncbi:MAG: SAM-dependent methyltransferase [Cyclobacteriaceae bacterium]